MACGGIPKNYNDDVYEKFVDQVGWRRSGDWLSDEELTFLLNGSKHAQLPLFIRGWRVRGRGDIFFLFTRRDL